MVSGNFRYTHDRGWVGLVDLEHYPLFDISSLPDNVQDGIWKFQIHPDIVYYNDEGYPCIRENTYLFRPDTQVTDFYIFDRLLSDLPSWRHKLIGQEGEYAALWFADTTYVSEPFPHYYTFLTTRQLVDLLGVINHVTRHDSHKCFMTSEGSIHAITENGQPVNIWYTQMALYYYAYDHGDWILMDFRYPGYNVLYFGMLPFKTIFTPLPEEEPPQFNLWTLLLSAIWPFLPYPGYTDPREIQEEGKVPIPYIWFDFDGSKTGEVRFYIDYWKASGSPPPLTVNVTDQGEIQPPSLPDVPEIKESEESQNSSAPYRATVWTKDAGATFGTIRNKSAYSMNQTLDSKAMRELLGSKYTLPEGIQGKAVNYTKIDRLHGILTIEVVK